MDPSSNIDSKIGADAINPKPPSAGNLSSKEANSNPLLKDSKRIIKKMIVMDTSRLKGLGIESTIKNAMSKLGKGRQSTVKRTPHVNNEFHFDFLGKSIKVEPPTFTPFTPTNAQPTLTSPKVPETIIKTEREREQNSVTVKPAVTVIKQIYRPGVPFPATSNSTTDPVPVQPKSNNDKPMLIHPVIQLPRQSNPASANTVSFQSGKVMSPPISVIKTVTQSTSVPSTSNINVPSSTIPSVRGHVQSNCNAKVVPSQTNSPVIKVESTAPSTASDGKKIKVLSNVSLVDGKSKLLEIDKLSSKNLKFTNVIKGTDKSPPKATHSSSNSAGKPELPSHSNAMPAKVPVDRTTKFIHVIKGPEEYQPRTTASVPITVNAPVFVQSSTAKSFPTGGNHVIKGPEERQPRTTASAPITVNVPVFPQSSTTKPLPTGVKLTASVNLRPQSVSDEMHTRTTRLIFHAGKQHVKPTITSAMPAKTEEEKFASKNLKISSSADGMNKTIPPKILNFSNVSCGGAAKTGFLNYSVRPSYPTSKPIRTEVNTIPPKNVIFTNTSRPTIQTTNATRKPTMPLYPPPSTPTKTEFVEIKPHNFNQPNCKSSKESPLYNVPKPPISKVAKPVPSTSSTSAATEVATKQLVTTDENIEIRKPSTQKYLIKSTVSTVSSEMTVSDNEARYRRFHEAVWSTNNPRTYARHNIKRLLSDKIIKKSRPPGVTIVEHGVDGPTSEIFNPERMDQMNDQDVTSNVTCDSKSESAKSEASTEAQNDKFVLLTTEPLQSNPVTSVPKPVDDNIGVLDNEPMDVDIETGKATSVPMETSSHCNQSQVDDSVQSSPSPVNISENNFCGFSVEEVNAGHLLISQIKAILSENRRHKTTWVSAKIASETEKKMVDQDSKHWSLNLKAGLLEEKIDKDVKVTQKHVQPSTETELCQPNVVKEPISTGLNLLPTQTSNETELELGLSPSKTPVIEDADDEISDIDLIHRSKPKCTGSTMNRRAIFKSIELHRKSVLPATTDDDESELSLSVRPPRPKLRRSRQKQTLEQLKVQQHAHVSLLKRFVQTDSDYDNLSEEVLMSFIDSVDRRIEVLENQVKDCFKSKICVDDLNVEAISEQSVTSSVDIMKELEEPVKSSESVTKPQIVNPSKDSSNIHSQLDSAATGDAERPEPIIPSNFDATDSEHRQGE